MHSSVIHELPLVLKAALGISHLKRFYSHNEVINKFLRDRFKTSISIIHPFIVEYLISIWAFHIIDIKEYLTKVNICYHYIPFESSVEQVRIWGDNFNIYVEFNWQAKGTTNP